jgi:hypothetical protein
MSALLETHDEDDDDGTASLYKDSGAEDVNQELGDVEDDEPIAGVDENEDEEDDEEQE